MSDEETMSIDALVLCAQVEGSKRYPESFELGELVRQAYERQTQGMSAVMRYDFRRAFELGYAFAMMREAASDEKSL
jgi:hypothetical protein